MSAMKKRKCLTIEEKRNIILSLESGCSNTFISQQYNLSHSTVSNIFKQRMEIKQMFDQAGFTKKKIRYSMHRDIEKALLEWFKCHKDSHISINIQSLQAKADEFANLFGKTNFKCSSSWVQRFKRRHCKEFAKTVSSKSKEQTQRVDNSCAKITKCNFTTTQDVAADWLQNLWPALREGFSDEEIYTATETGIFYRLMPDQLFKFQRQRCIKGEFSKERLTVLVTANLTMTDKKKLLVIGKFKNPKSFKNLKTLPVQYEYNQKAWMTSSIFNQFLQKWDIELCQEGKKVLVLIDDSSVHSQLDQQLQSIRVVYLPNNPPLVKLMQQRIAKSLKLQFKKQLILCHIKKIENNENTKINIFQAICILESAWEQVIPQTNCFGYAALKEVKASIEEDLDSWASNLLFYDTETLKQFENVDTELVTSNQILSVESNNHRYDNEEEIKIEESDDDEEIEKITLNQAFDALNKLKHFLATEEHFSKSYNHTKQLQILLEKSLYKQKNSQTKITSYFKKIY